MAGKEGMATAAGSACEHGNLTSFIEKVSLECLNEDSAYPVGNAFDGQPHTWLQSDPSTDTQLLLSVGFRLPVKISAVKITVPPGAEENMDAPLSIKLFVGKDDSLDFAEAETRECTQELEVKPGEEMPVRFVKFQGVQFLRVFVPGSTGGDDHPTKITSIQFIGIPAQAMDMKDWKPIKG